MGHLGESTPITTVQDKEIVLTGSDGHTFKMKVVDLAEAVRQVMPVATGNTKGLFGGSLYDLSFKTESLPQSGVNQVGNHDGTPSGYGWYNNSNSGIDTYAPAATAGAFIRFNSIFAGARITFFIVIDGDPSRIGKVWSRIDRNTCKEFK